MKSYEEMTKEELLKEKEGLEAEYKKFQQRGLKLDMSRGKPSIAQLNLSMGMIPGTVRPFDGNDGCTDFRC